MITTVPIPSAPTDCPAPRPPEREAAIPPSDLLTRLQLEVARRADELARGRPASSSLNLHCWLLAEAEVFASSLRRPDAAAGELTN